MKVEGPKGAPPTGQAPAERAVDRSDRAETPSFQEILEGREVAPSHALPDLAAITARLRAGEISGAEATERIIEAVVRSRAAALTPETAEALRTTLRRIVAEDPFLADKIKKLGEAEE